MYESITSVIIILGFNGKFASQSAHAVQMGLNFAKNSVLKETLNTLAYFRGNVRTCLSMTGFYSIHHSLGSKKVNSLAV